MPEFMQLQRVNRPPIAGSEQHGYSIACFAEQHLVGKIVDDPEFRILQRRSYRAAFLELCR
jgi:hypothetical protein